MSPLVLAASAAAVGLLVLAARTAQGREGAPVLPPPLAEAPPTTVLLPVRNEELHLVSCAESLLGQTAHPRVIVIDDGSTDRTGQLARGLAGRHGRLTVVDAGPLPEGWRGKVHALAAGWRTLETDGGASDWVLSTDADTRHHPECLARALAAAEASRLDAVSLAGLQEARGPGENLLGPPVFALLDSLLGDWAAAARGDGPPVANGQFFLIRRRALEAIGGFAAIRGAAMDDITLADRLAEHGFRVGFVRAPELLSVRMYQGLASMVRGWRRNLGGLFGSRPAPVVGVLATLLLPPALLVLATASGLLVPAVLLWGAGAAASAGLRRGSGNLAVWGLLYPADSILLAVTLLAGVIDHRRGELHPWKGRRMGIDPPQDSGGDHSRS